MAATAGATDRQEKDMVVNPNLATQLAREHQQPHWSPAPRTPGPAARITRRLAAAISRAGVAAHRRPAPSGQPARIGLANQPPRPPRLAAATDGRDIRHYGQQGPAPDCSLAAAADEDLGALAVSKLGHLDQDPNARYVPCSVSRTRANDQYRSADLARCLRL